MAPEGAGSTEAHGSAFPLLLQSFLLLVLSLHAIALAVWGAAFFRDLARGDRCKGALTSAELLKQERERRAAEKARAGQGSKGARATVSYLGATCIGRVLARGTCLAEVGVSLFRIFRRRAATSDWVSSGEMGQWLTYMRPKRTEDITAERLAEELRRSKYVVALTGAGVSAESGIPTFRDPSDGLWQRYDPAVYATIWGFWRHPNKIWQLLHEFLNEHEPEPNQAHVALARLEDLGFIRAIITQNVDNLHQDAGSKRVIEYHGNLMSASCYRCGAKMQLTKQMARDPSFRKKLPPRCACGGYFKPDAVLFGEGIPSKAVRDANTEADACDLMLVVGTSATVHPASDIPYRAMRNGAKVIEVNLEKTGLTNRISDMFYQGRASELVHVVELLEARLRGPRLAFPPGSVATPRELAQ